MKLKYIIPSFVAVLAMLVGCSDDDSITLLDEVQVSSSYVSLATGNEGTPAGTEFKNEITVTAKADWSIDETTVPDWLTIAPMSGQAGETKVVFTAGPTLDGRTASISLNCAGAKQTINIIQGLAVVSDATVAEVMKGPDSKTFRVTGVVTKIANTQYGNFYMNDGTSAVDLYIYGTVNAAGKYDWASFGIEVGDEVTVEGPKTTYGTTIELVDATFISVNKSLIKVESVLPETGELPLEGGEFTVNLACKGQGVTVDIPEDAKEWLSIASIESAAETATVVFKAQENKKGDRSTTIIFKTTDGKKEYAAEAALMQKGSIIPVSIADFNAAADGDTQYRITGYVKEITNEKYGNCTIVDATGETAVYGTTDLVASGFKVGDIITLVGQRSTYKDAPQIKNIVLEKLVPVTPISVADFLALEDDKETFYLLKGTVGAPANSANKYDLETYGNFDITDATGSAYVYGVSTGVGGETKKFSTLGVAEGDEITIIGYKTSYKDNPQVGGAMYISHTSAE